MSLSCVSVVSVFYMEPAYSDGSPSSDALTHTRAHPPGPMPTLMMSAPERMSSSTISPVTTLPACKTRQHQPPRYKSPSTSYNFWPRWSNRAPYHDGVSGELSSDRLDKLHKVLGVAVGHVQTDVLEGGDGFQDGTQLLQIGNAAAWAGGYVLRREKKAPTAFFKQMFVIFFLLLMRNKPTWVTLPLNILDD